MAALGWLLTACGAPDVTLGTVDYARVDFAVSCAPGARGGAGGATHRLELEPGLVLSVRTPANYDPTRAHPLLVVYPAAGHGRFASEVFAGLTASATAVGFIVVYSDHRPLTRDRLALLGRIPQAVAARWCIDPGRIFASGHSDGGLSAEAVAFLGTATPPLAGLAASGAGIRGVDLQNYDCPVPLPVMLIHSRGDRRFPLPEYGADAARWWAQCNGCDVDAGAQVADTCVDYARCAAATRYCEIDGPHERRHGLNAALLGFLRAAL